MKNCLFYLLVLAFFSSNIQAQTNGNLDSIALVIQYHFDYDSGQKKLNYIKSSHYDTNNVLVLQERLHLAVDTIQGRLLISRIDTQGALVEGPLNSEEEVAVNIYRNQQPQLASIRLNSYYHYHYDPSTHIGNSYNETFSMRAGNTTYKKEETKFKSYDHREKRLWQKHYDADKRLTREIENKYDSSGFLISTSTRDHEYSPPMVQQEEIQRNALGLMTVWESYDEDENGKQKVREMRWEYKHDSLILRNSGYLYNDWNETINTYDKKTNLLTKRSQHFGYRQDDGVIKRKHRQETTYKAGRPTKIQEYEYERKTKSHTFVYNGDLATETISEKGQATIVITVQKRYDEAGRLLEYVKSKNGNPEYKEVYQYDAMGQLLNYAETEYRGNGADAEKTTVYDAKGNPSTKILRIGGKLSKLDEYEYRKR